MTRWQYRAVHTAVAAVWGKSTNCELKGCTNAKRYEWSNKSHTYSLDRSDWWQLCSKCHSEFDGKTFGAPIPWNKGLWPTDVLGWPGAQTRCFIWLFWELIITRPRDLIDSK